MAKKKSKKVAKGRAAVKRKPSDQAAPAEELGEEALEQVSGGLALQEATQMESRKFQRVEAAPRSPRPAKRGEGQGEGRPACVIAGDLEGAGTLSPTLSRKRERGSEPRPDPLPRAGRESERRLYEGWVRGKLRVPSVRVRS
jgi:hypothetical protein